MFGWDAVSDACLLAFLAAAASSDIRTGRIPNWLNLAGAALGLLKALLLPAAGSDPWYGLGIAFGVVFLLYLVKGVGGGDVKMMAGVGLLSGYPTVVYYLFYASLAAFVIMLAPRVWRGELLVSLKRSFRPAGSGADAKTGSVAGSFALAMLVGVVWVWVMAAL